MVFYGIRPMVCADTIHYPTAIGSEVIVCFYRSIGNFYHFDTA